MTLQEYREFVRRRAIEHDGQAIYNESIEHASIVVENLFKNAMEKIVVLSGSFNPRVYGRDEVVKEAELFLALSPENKLQIIIESDLKESRGLHPFFMTCSRFPNLEVRVATPNVQDRYDFHFVAVDEDSYRFKSDKKLPAAISAFGDQAGAKNLGGIHSQLWNLCVPPASSGASLSRMHPRGS